MELKTFLKCFLKSDINGKYETKNINVNITPGQIVSFEYAQGRLRET